VPPVRRATLLLSALAAGLTFAPSADAAARFKRCGGPGFTCTRVSVPLDRAGAVSGRVSLFVARQRPRRRRATRPPLIFLAGGPGQSATNSLVGAFGTFLPEYGARDLIIFDQRGTGRSGLLRCRRLERSNLLDAGREAGACARSLGARRAFYTSRDSVEDIEAIRRRLGAERIALYGVSYGTKVALGYASTYPDRVERLALDSVVAPGGPDPLYLDSIAAVPRALRALCVRRCSWTGDAVADLATLVDRIASGGPLRGIVVDARGRRRARSLSRVDLFTILVAGDFDPVLRGSFPGAVSAGLAGDPAPLLRLRGRALQVDAVPPPPRALSTAVYAATTCEEAALPWDRTTPPDPAERHSQAAARAQAIADASFEPFDRATMLASDTLALCERWPHAPVARGFGPGPLPDVPVLLIEGEDDLRTPVESAQRVAQLFPHSSLVVARATGHSALGMDLSGCSQQAFSSFFRGRALSEACRRVRREFPPTPPPPRRLADVPPLDGSSGVRGRTLAALRLTLDDVAADASTALVFDPADPDIARGGGLRAGRYRIDSRFTVELRGLAFIPGVTVSGRLRHFGERWQRGRLRIGGGAAPHGLLHVAGQRVRGRLGGRRVSATLRAPTAARVAAAAKRPRLPLR
jgi:pimeloyl-ACP methyl ester carboxylesterase